MITTDIEIHEDRKVITDLPLDHDNRQVELPVCPQPDGPIVYDDVENEIRFLTHDDHCYDYDFPEGVEFVQGNRNYINFSADVDSWVREMRETHHILSVGVYEHGGISYSLTGESIHASDPWDYVSCGALIAIPRGEYPEPTIAARNILAEYTAWCNGDVWNVWRVPLNDPENYDVVGGFIGSEWAEQAVVNGDF